MRDVRTLLYDLVVAGDANTLRELRCAVVEAESAVIARRKAGNLASADSYYAAEVRQLRCLAGVYLAEMDMRLERAMALRGTSYSDADMLGDCLERLARARDNVALTAIFGAVADARDAARSLTYAMDESDEEHAIRTLASMRSRLQALRVAPAGAVAPALDEGSPCVAVDGTPADDVSPQRPRSSEGEMEDKSMTHHPSVEGDLDTLKALTLKALIYAHVTRMGEDDDRPDWEEGWVDSIEQLMAWIEKVSK